MTKTSYIVTGMTCGHCTQAVTEEVSKISGVSDVTVDLPTGAVTISSPGTVNEAEVRAAVEEAGYELAAQ